MLCSAQLSWASGCLGGEMASRDPSDPRQASSTPRPVTGRARRAGRPRSSSRQMLVDAASELFLETSYADTTVDQITQRAGVSRNTFFNYFQAKSDLLWLEVDAGIVALAAELASATAAPVTAI